MTAEKRSPEAESERKARARELARIRKQRFDAKVRNAGGDGGAQRRTGTTLYLSDAAREVLERNRERRRNAGLPRILDANLVESLLLAYAQQGEPECLEGPFVVDETKSNPQIDKLLVKQGELEQALMHARLHWFAAEGTIERLEEEAENDFKQFDWVEIQESLLAMHDKFGSTCTVQAIGNILGGTAHDQVTSASKALHRELAEHIKSLVHLAEEWT